METNITLPVAAVLLVLCTVGVFSLIDFLVNIALRWTRAVDELLRQRKDRKSKEILKKLD